MPVTWADFSSTVSDPRFLIPIRRFEYVVRYVSVSPDDSDLRRLADLISGAVVAAVAGRPACELSALRLQPGAPDKPDRGPRPEDSEPSFFTVVFGNPVYDFALQVGPTTFKIAKLTTTTSDLVDSVPLFEDICRRVFGAPTTGDPVPSPGLLDFVKARIYRASFKFVHRITLGSHFSQRSRQAVNTELLERLLKLSPTPGTSVPADRDAPLWALAPEEIRRGDVTLSFVRTFDGARKRTVWVQCTGWWNIKMRDFDLDVEYRCGDAGDHVRTEDLLDWETPIAAFYHDMILNKLMPNLFFDIEVQPRLGE